MLMYLSGSGQFFHLDHPLTQQEQGHGHGRRKKISKPSPMAQTDCLPSLGTWKLLIWVNFKEKVHSQPQKLGEGEKWRQGCCPTCGVLQQEPTPVLVIVLSRLQQVQIWGEFDSNYSVFDDVVYEKQQNLNYKENEEKQQPERNKSLGFVTIQ